MSRRHRGTTKAGWRVTGEFCKKWRRKQSKREQIQSRGVSWLKTQNWKKSSRSEKKSYLEWYIKSYNVPWQSYIRVVQCGVMFWLFTSHNIWFHCQWFHLLLKILLNPLSSLKNPLLNVFSLHGNPIKCSLNC